MSIQLFFNSCFPFLSAQDTATLLHCTATWRLWNVYHMFFWEMPKLCDLSKRSGKSWFHKPTITARPHKWIDGPSNALAVGVWADLEVLLFEIITIEYAKREYESSWNPNWLMSVQVKTAIHSQMIAVWGLSRASTQFLKRKCNYRCQVFSHQGTTVYSM